MALLLSIVMLAGCRLYGQGFHPQDEVYRQMVKENDDFARELAQVQQSALRLGQQQTQDSAMARFVRQLQATVAVHQTLLEEHRELASKFSAGEWQYRPIHRAFLAILAEDEMIRLRYADLIRPQVEGDPRLLEQWNDLPDGRYQIAPPYYEHLAAIAQVASTQGMANLGQVQQGDSAFQATTPAEPLQSGTPTDTTSQH